MTGPHFAYWFGVGCLCLVFIVAYFVLLDLIERWNDQRRASRTEGKQYLKLTAEEAARIYNHKQAAKRPAVRIDAARRGKHDAA